MAVLFALTAALLPRQARCEDSPASKPNPLLIKDFLYDLDRGIKFGPVAFHAYLSEYISYNDNLQLTQTGKTADFLVDSVAGARIDLKYGPHRAMILAEGEYVKGIQTSIHDHLNAMFSVMGALKGQSTFLEVKDTFRYEQQAENLFYAPLGNWVKFMSNELNLQAGLKISKIGFEIEAGVANWFFMDAPLQYMDHMDLTGALRVSYTFVKVRPFISGDFGYTDFSRQYVNPLNGEITRLSDYIYYGGTIGATFDLSGKLDGLATFGIRMQSVIEPGTLADTSSYTGFIASLGLNYKFSSIASAGALYFRALQFSGQSNYQTTDSITVHYRHEIMPRLTGKAGLRLMLITPGSGSSYVFYGGHVQLDYRLFDWFHIGLKYELRARQSGLAGGSYLNNVVSLSLTGYF